MEKVPFLFEAEDHPLPGIVLEALTEEERLEHPTHRLVVQLPLSNFITGATGFSDGAPGSSSAVGFLKLLLMLAHLVECPWTCTAEHGDAKACDVDLAAKDGYMSVTCPDDGVRRPVPRVQVTYEAVRRADGDGVGMVRLWFDIQDRAMSFSRGIENRIKLNNLSQGKMGAPKKPAPWKVHLDVFTRRQFLDEFLSTQSLCTDADAGTSLQGKDSTLTFRFQVSPRFGRKATRPTSASGSPPTSSSTITIAGPSLPWSR